MSETRQKGTEREGKRVRNDGGDVLVTTLQGRVAVSQTELGPSIRALRLTTEKSTQLRGPLID